jgi:hypothetical protein
MTDGRSHACDEVPLSFRAVGEPDVSDSVTNTSRDTTGTELTKRKLGSSVNSGNDQIPRRVKSSWDSGYDAPRTDDDALNYLSSIIVPFNDGSADAMRAAIDWACSDQCIMETQITKVNGSAPLRIVSFNATRYLIFSSPSAARCLMRCGLFEQVDLGQANRGQL